MRISSSDNPLYRRLRTLAQSPGASRTERATLAEGLHVVQAALAANSAIETLVLRAGARAPETEALAGDARQRRLRIVELAPALYERIAGVTHGAGILAELRVATPELPRQLAADAVYLDGVQDPGNVGAILRTAAAAGVRHVIADAATASLWSPKVMRSGMGAHFGLHLYEGVTAAEAVVAFAAEVLAADARGGDDFYTGDWGEGATLWLFGAEGQGLSAAAAACAQRRLRIPIASAVESLNVAAAAAVCLFEQRRRRLA